MIILSEKETRLLIRKYILEGVAWKKNSSNSSTTGKSSSDSSDERDFHVSGNYPKENVDSVLKALDEKGITNKFLRVGILCTIAKESNFVPKSELPYNKTDVSSILRVWPRLKSLGNSKIESLKKETSKSDGNKIEGLGLFDYVYANQYGNGSKESGDGSRYRGRGYNQVTFKSSYEKYGKIAGIDLVNDPDKLNDPNIAAKVCVAFLANRIKADKGTVNPDIKTYEEGIKIAAEANCKSPGAKKDCSKAIKLATDRLKDFIK